MAVYNNSLGLLDCHWLNAIILVMEHELGILVRFISFEVKPFDEIACLGLKDFPRIAISYFILCNSVFVQFLMALV